MLTITFTDRFQKHYKDLSAVEKKQFKTKLAIFAENPLHPSLRTKVRMIYLIQCEYGY